MNHVHDETCLPCTSCATSPKIEDCPCPPPEVYQPPEGYKWTGERFKAGKTDIPATYADFSPYAGRWLASEIADPDYDGTPPLIRKIRPDRLDVSLPFGAVKDWAQFKTVLGLACKRAIEKWECGNG